MRPYYVYSAKTLLRETVGRANSLFARAPKRFVIFTDGRTGSNLLVSLLKGHRHIRVHAEIFGEYQLEDLAVRSAINKLGPIEFYKRAFRRLVSEKLIGLKILYHQLEPQYGRSRGIPEVWTVKDQILRDRNLLFIHLKRKDLLARLVSKKLALLSGNWSRGDYGVGPVSIESDWALEELSRMERSEREYDQLLPVDRTLTINYEDLVCNRESEMIRALNFLGAEKIPLRSSLVKQNKKNHRESIVNYDELRTALDGSPYSGLFRQ